MIYLASPYTHPQLIVRRERFNAVCRKAAEMMRGGMLVFSPIAHSHPMTEYGLPPEWDYWERYDRAMLERCTELVVFMLPGWRESKGVCAEIEIARQLGKPVKYIDEESTRPYIPHD